MPRVPNRIYPTSHPTYLSIVLRAFWHNVTAWSELCVHQTKTETIIKAYTGTKGFTRIAQIM